MRKLTAAQQTTLVAAIAKSTTLTNKVERRKAFGVVINSTINGQSLKELAGEAMATDIAGRVLDQLGFERYAGIEVKVKL